MERLEKISEPVIVTGNRQKRSWLFVCKMSGGRIHLQALIYSVETRKFHAAKRNTIGSAGNIDFSKSFLNIPLFNVGPGMTIMSSMREQLTDADTASCIAASIGNSRR